MICPWCKQEFTNYSFSELCPTCDCGYKPDGTKWTLKEMLHMKIHTNSED